MTSAPLAEWLRPMPLAEFLREVYLHRPFSRPCNAGLASALCTWEVLGEVLAHPDPPDVLVTRDGRLLQRPAPRSLAAARAALRDGATVVVRDADRHHAALRELADALARDLEGRVAVQIYATPAGRFGFGWHYDVEEVFVLQADGVKDYRFRANSVNPLPVLENMPADLRYEREVMPCEQVTLAPGGWLYLPAGYWHRAEARTDALSLSIGVFQPTPLDVLQAVRRLLLRSAAWRQRLPPSLARIERAGAGSRGGDGGAAGPPASGRFAPLEPLGAELARLLADPSFLCTLPLDGSAPAAPPKRRPAAAATTLDPTRPSGEEDPIRPTDGAPPAKRGD